MALFTWYNKYSVNNEELDNHHKNLFKLFNRLYENCLQAGMPNCTGPIIDELILYSVYHFQAEEQFMANTGYKDIVNHKQMHCYFIEIATEMQKVENKDDYEHIKDLIVFLGDWLMHHVIEEDKKYAV